MWNGEIGEGRLFKGSNGMKHDHNIPIVQVHTLPSSDLSVPRPDPNDLGCMGGNLSAVRQDHLHPTVLLDIRHK